MNSTIFMPGTQHTSQPASPLVYFEYFEEIKFEMETFVQKGLYLFGTAKISARI